jgi:putative colanic acid biosynthesis UDP-glucose lipid carrier transferase
MSGWAQVHGWRGNTSLENRIDFDVWYVENWSIILDFKIMFLTFFKQQNAY